MGSKVIIAPSAQTDLSEIVAYIARQNPDAALRLGAALIDRAERLARFPELGRMVPEFATPNLRELPYKSFRIIYRVRNKQRLIEIVRFWHAARGFPRLH
jgi:toxin ParE1/3/4